MELGGVGGRKEKEVRGKGGQPRWEERQGPPSPWQEAPAWALISPPKLLHLEKLARSLPGLQQPGRWGFWSLRRVLCVPESQAHIYFLRHNCLLLPPH